MIDGLQQRADRIIGAAFDADGTLAHRRQHLVDLEDRAAGGLKAQAVQAGARQQGRVDLARLELAQAGVEIAAQGRHAQVRAARQQLGAPAQRDRADHRSVRQPVDPAGTRARDQHVARIGPRQHRADRKARRQPGRQVLHRMHREIDPAVEQRRLELLAEQPLAAELGERPVDHEIAGRADHHDLERARRGEPRVGLAKRAAHQPVCLRASGEPRVPMRTTAVMVLARPRETTYLLRS